MNIHCERIYSLDDVDRQRLYRSSLDYIKKGTIANWSDTDMPDVDILQDMEDENNNEIQWNPHRNYLIKVFDSDLDYDLGLFVGTRYQNIWKVEYTYLDDHPETNNRKWFYEERSFSRHLLNDGVEYITCRIPYRSGYLAFLRGKKELNIVKNCVDRWKKFRNIKMKVNNV